MKEELKKLIEKAGTLKLLAVVICGVLLLFFSYSENADEKAAGSVAGNEAVKIKFEVDIDPPAGATFEHKYRLLPAPYEVRLYDMPSLFAGKLHAVICRSWQSRIKGRDLYDYVFYLSQGASVNIKHLRHRLVQSGYIGENDKCSLNDVKDMLIERFNNIANFFFRHINN